MGELTAQLTLSAVIANHRAFHLVKSAVIRFRLLAEVMRRIVVLLLIVGVWAVPLFAQVNAEAELRATIAERLSASLTGDTDVVASFMAEDYLQTDISGRVQDKTTWLKEYFVPLAELIKAGKFRWEKYAQNELQFRVHGDSAVVIGRLDAKGTGAAWSPQLNTWVADPRASFSGTLRFTHVYVKRNGKWLLVALQNAVPIAPPSAKP